MIHPDGRYEAVVPGPDLAQGQRPGAAVAGGSIGKATELPAGEYDLVSEVVSPGWEMQDMILVTRPELLARFPQHEAVITRLTPNP